jgi:predicted transcriptional regulator
MIKYSLTTKTNSVVSTIEASSLKEAREIFINRKRLNEEVFDRLFTVIKNK